MCGYNFDSLKKSSSFGPVKKKTQAIFDEITERHWIKQWLFYGNSIKYSSAMTGAPDYSSFKLGWWELSKNLQEMKELIEAKESR